MEIVFMQRKKECVMRKNLKAMDSFSVYGKTGLSIILLFILLTTSYYLGGSQMYKIPSGASLEPPSLEHPLGTDDLGIDILAQMLHGAGISIFIGISVALLAGVGGSIVGITAGYYGSWLDKVLMGISDVLQVIPHMSMIIILGMFFGSSLKNMIFVISVLSWVGPARVARARILSLKKEKFIMVSRAYGASFFHLLLKHFIPRLLPMITVGVIRILSHAIVAEAGIAFLGLGDPTAKSWGMMLNRALNFQGIYFTDFWKWWVLSPWIFLMALILSIAFVGRDIEKVANRKL